jgi:hypothetical protein
MDTLLLRSSLYFTTFQPNTLHSPSLHLSKPHLFPVKLHPTTLHYEDIFALCKVSTALHSVPPHSLVTHIFCVLRIILWPILFVCKVSCLFVVSLCVYFFVSVFPSVPHYYVLCHIPPCAWLLLSLFERRPSAL